MGAPPSGRLGSGPENLDINKANINLVGLPQTGLAYLYFVG